MEGIRVEGLAISVCVCVCPHVCMYTCMTVALHVLCVNVFVC